MSAATAFSATPTVTVSECRLFPGEWLVEVIHDEDEGQCEMVRFTGPGSEERSRRYFEFIT